MTELNQTLLYKKDAKKMLTTGCLTHKNCKSVGDKEEVVWSKEAYCRELRVYAILTKIAIYSVI